MKKFITFLVVLTTFLSTSYGQGGSVKGTVKDTDGLALIGATVQVENTNTAVVTDLDGNYVLSGVPSGANLVFSYVGMESQTVAVAGKGVVDVTLSSDSSELDEVIVIGYGTTTKRKAVGAVSSIDSEKVEASTYPDIQTALQGQVPGLFVSNAGASMNDTASVSIRGGGEPMYVIDGVIAGSTEFSMLNPSDIESMSFLKDASATAVYGSQAGDGIVLVQTKRGEAGKTKVTYSGSFQVSQPTMFADRASSATYMDLVNEVTVREGGSTVYSASDFANIGSSIPDNDWPSLIYRDWAFQQKHNLGISGGTENTKYYATLGQYTNNGILQHDLESMTRTNFRANIVSNIDKLNMTFNASMNASIQETIQMGWQNYRTALYYTAPTQAGYNPDGTVANTPQNPIYYFNDTNDTYGNYDKNFLNAKMDLTWAPKSVKGLTAGVMAAYKNLSHFNRSWTAYGDMYNYDYETETSTSVGVDTDTEMSVSASYYRYVDLEARLAYNRTFGKHTLEGLILYTQRTSSSDYVWANRNVYFSNSVDQLWAGSETQQFNTGYATEGGTQGLVFRAKYDYADKYIVEFSGRYDGNDDFAPGYRWGFFPSVSGVWIASDEAFMQPLVDDNIINFLKVRASYGVTGVSDSDYRFAYLSGYSSGDAAFYSSGAYQTTYQEGALTDPSSLSWYTRKSINLGVDLGFANNKFQLSGDYFFYVTTGYLANPTDEYDVTLGTDFPAVVTDTTHRREGFEFSLTYQNRFGDWDISVGGNVTKYNELYTQLDTETGDTLYNPYTRETQRDSNWSELMYSTSGYYTTTDQLLNSARYYKYSDQEFGDLLYVDTNGDGQITEDDMRMNDQPYDANLSYGLNFRVAWKNLSLSGLWQGVGTRMRYLGDNFAKCSLENAFLTEQYDYWSEDNTDARFPILSTTNTNQNYTTADVWFENARYIRLKNLSLTYNLKSSVLQNVAFIEGMTISLTGTNLLTFSPWYKYSDPEDYLVLDTDTKGSGNTTTTNAHSPIQRSYSLGINLTF